MKEFEKIISEHFPTKESQDNLKKNVDVIMLICKLIKDEQRKEEREYCGAW